MTDEEKIKAINNACEAFCKVKCNGKPPRSTCTSLGTCKEYDNFLKSLQNKPISEDLKKKFYICIDGISVRDIGAYRDCCWPTYSGTETALKFNEKIIITTSIAHLSFETIRKGYDLYLCYEDKKIKIEEGMKLGDSEMTLRPATYLGEWDILDYFKAGYFNKLLGIQI